MINYEWSLFMRPPICCLFHGITGQIGLLIIQFYRSEPNKLLENWILENLVVATR